MQFTLGSRWISETEPELGLGILIKVEGRRIFLSFPGKDVTRQYNAQGAPIQRAKFEIGDEIESADGVKLKVEEIVEEEGLYVYFGEGKSLVEVLLADSLSFNKPEEKLFLGQWDKNSVFDLRIETHRLRKRWLGSPWRGYLGPRISLLPHQFFVAQSVVESPFPRVLLADEVGLGKTIEAGLILHKLKISGRVDRVLIIVPEALIYQWFVEMLRKFQLSFSVVDEQTYGEDGDALFDRDTHHLLSLQLLIKNPSMIEKIQSQDHDLLIVDEAHRLDWTEEHISKEYECVEQLALSIPGLLLLSATPEQLGEAGHFARLRLLDPDRYTNLEKYREEKQGYQKIGALAQNILQKKTLSKEEEKLCSEANIQINAEDLKSEVRKLLDVHGTGRVFYRNTRDSIQDTFDFIPERRLKNCALDLVKKKEGSLSEAFYTRVKWLLDHVQGHPDEKFLLICSSKQQVLEIEKYLQSFSQIKIGMFHSDLQLMAKDRQAAYFAEPAGSQILLCTEIGSEGRNFAFVNNLVLFDLPRHPDLLEQRIGRLDRIGQRKHIQIWVPYVKDTAEQRLFEWYHIGLGAFEKPMRGALKVYEEFSEQLMAGLQGVDIPENEWNGFIEKAQMRHKEILHLLESGRDLLVEWNSFDQDQALDIIKNVKELEDPDLLFSYMEKVFHHLGVQSEDLDGDCFFVNPGDNMFIPHFPELTNDGVSLTYKRWKASEREELRFVTWDHPMTTGAMDLIIGEQIGNVTVSRWLGERDELLLECLFMVTPVAPKAFEMDRYLPPTLLRVVMNARGEDVSKKYNEDELRMAIKELPPLDRDQVRSLPKKAVKDIIKMAEGVALKRAAKGKAKAIEKMQNMVGEEKERLITLQQKGALISQEDLDFQDKKAKILQDYIEKAPVALDALRLTF